MPAGREVDTLDASSYGSLGWRDVRAQGARGDGSADDTGAIQSALYNLPTRGGTIFLPPGRFVVSGGLQTPADRPCHIIGSGHEATQLVLANGKNVDVLTLNGQFQSVQNLSIDANYPSNLVAGNGIVVKKTKCMLRNLWVVNAREAGIKAIGDATEAAHAGFGTNIYLFGNQGAGTVGQLWHGDYSYDWKWANVWIGGSPSAKGVFGLYGNAISGPQPSECHFVNLHVWGHGSDGINWRADNFRLANSYIETNDGHGLNLTSARGALITGNRFWFNSGNGAYLFDGSHHGIVGNRFTDQLFDGVRGDGNCRYVRVVGNDFTNEVVGGSQDYAVHTMGTCDFWIVTNNVMLAADHAVGSKSLVGAGNVLANNIE